MPTVTDAQAYNSALEDAAELCTPNLLFHPDEWELRCHLAEGIRSLKLETPPDNSSDSGMSDNPYLMVTAVLEDGKISSNPEFIVIGHIHDYSLSFIGEAEEAVIEHIQEFEEDWEPIPEHMRSLDSVQLKVSDISWCEGQMSWPETGQWDFPPHWEMDIELIQPERKGAT